MTWLDSITSMMICQEASFERVVLVVVETTCLGSCRSPSGSHSLGNGWWKRKLLILVGKTEYFGNCPLSSFRLLGFGALVLGGKEFHGGCIEYYCGTVWKIRGMDDERFGSVEATKGIHLKRQKTNEAILACNAKSCHTCISMGFEKFVP